MASFILVHGAWHAGWCWDKLTPILESHGHTVRVLDLPGHGRDSTAKYRVTLESYGQAIRDAIRDLDEPVIAVGHSMGGLAISYAAELPSIPITKLIYLCALMPISGENIRSLIAKDRGSQIPCSLKIALHKAGAVVRRDRAKELFYNDCSEEDANWAVSNLCVQPGRPLFQKIRFARQRFRELPRVYIKCLQDKVLSPGFQQDMCDAVECDQVITMNTSHSPFLSSPKELAEHLHTACA